MMARLAFRRPDFPTILACLLLLWPLPGSAADEALILRLVPERVKQGGLATLWIEGAAPLAELRIQLGERTIPVPAPSAAPGLGGRTPVWLGVDLEQPPGPLPITVEAVSLTGRPLRNGAVLEVAEGRYPVQRLTLPRAFTELDAATLLRVAQEKARLDSLWERVTSARPRQALFRPPLEGAGPGGGFGQRRIINGDPRAPHGGVDYPAPAGAPVLAANAGSVVLAEEHFFGGKSVVVDHGWGLYTIYLHLAEVLVDVGRGVERGEVIGRVGSTGRSTGPHLHWGVRLFGARIDPQELLRLPAEFLRNDQPSHRRGDP
jgi:murein DD-endopeptidase MepM/ murein hydrolase activator NlpD